MLGQVEAARAALRRGLVEEAKASEAVALLAAGEGLRDRNPEIRALAVEVAVHALNIAATPWQEWADEFYQEAWSTIADLAVDDPSPAVRRVALVHVQYFAPEWVENRVKNRSGENDRDNRP